jgi:hypothetical protein
MYKTRGQREEQDERLAEVARLEPDAIQTALLERAKHGALAVAVALLEQDAEALCGERCERKRMGQGYRGGHDQYAGMRSFRPTGNTRISYSFLAVPVRNNCAS